MNTILKYKLVFAVVMIFVGLGLNLAQAQAQNKVVVIPLGSEESAADLNSLAERVSILENATFNPLFGGLNTVSDLTCSSNSSNVLDASAISQIGGPCSDGSCYTCGIPNANLVQTENEHIFSFQCQTTGDVTIWLDNVTCDLDLYVIESSGGLFSGSSGAACIGGSTDVVQASVSNVFTCEEGIEYGIVVENAQGTTSCNYDIWFEAGLGMGCSEHCANGIDDNLNGDIDCDDSFCSSDPACITP